jgi:hypothetical protein
VCVCVCVCVSRKTHTPYLSPQPREAERCEPFFDGCVCVCVCVLPQLTTVPISQQYHMPANHKAVAEPTDIPDPHRSMLLHPGDGVHADGGGLDI